MHLSRRFRPLTIFAVTFLACERKSDTLTSRGSLDAHTPHVVISEIMANPRAVTDEHGEWFELQNLDAAPADLRGWRVASQNDRGVVIDERLTIAAHGFIVLARDGNHATNGGVAANYAYREGLTLGNAADWLALRTPNGRTVDSVAWTSTIVGASRALRDPTVPHADVFGAAWATSMTSYGKGDRGTPGQSNGATVVANQPSGGAGTPQLGGGATSRDSTLIVRVLDVGQGDAILIENGGSRVLIDGGPEPSRYGRLLDQFGIDHSTIDVVILTHQHADHYAGLRELFRSRRGITIRYLFENEDPSTSTSLAQLRDSVLARAKRGQLTLRDTDDPCGTGAAECTITLRGGAVLHVLRPDPQGKGPNNRSVAVKLIAPDSSRFTMWLAGDAEEQEISWFDATGYDRAPGMRASVMKADHHGSCDGISARYLDLVHPDVVVMSLGAVNDYGDVHTQTMDLLRSRRIPWYRTDQNGTITITVPPNGKYQLSAEKGTENMRGPSDRPARVCGDAQGRRRR